MSIFHKHKYGPVDDRGIQYCVSCGSARRLECSHVWEDVESETISDEHKRVQAKVIVSKCIHCGDRKKFTVGVGDIY